MPPYLSIQSPGRFLNQFAKRIHLRPWVGTLLFFFVFTLIHYRFSISNSLFLFLTGVLLAVPIAGAVETIFQLKYPLLPSPFIQLLLFIAAIFGLTSSGSEIGKGIVLTLLGYSILLQAKEVFKRIPTSLGTTQATGNNREDLFPFMVASIAFMILMLTIANR